ncbi:MAG: CotH kinase family protein [Bacillota bacterium]
MRKIVSGIVAVIMLLAVMTPVVRFKAFADVGPTLYINEIMASNTTTLRDGDIEDPTYGSQGGAFSDWIEIYNPGTQAVSLSGYTLSDSTATWTFPQGVVPANGYLLVWASDKNKVAADGQLHTNFKLGASGEPVTLTNSGGFVVDSVTYTTLASDQSYGRKTDGSSELLVLSKATPGAANIHIPAGTKTLHINEIMASNASVLRDGDVEDPTYGSQGGAYSDWIEIYNSGTQSVDLTGYTLSDSSATWTFPQGVIPANGYLLVWASDKNKVARDGQLHTNFKLGSTGEPIILKKADGTIVDSVTYVSLADNHSYGPKTDGGSEYVVFSKSSPRTSNTTGTILVKEPVFSFKGGFYTQAFDLQLTTDEPGAKIYYTKDGSDPVPGAAGTIEYTGSINVKSRAGEPNLLSMIQNISNDPWNPWKAPNGEVFKCTTIKAVVVRTDGVKSRTAAHSYFVDPGITTRYKVPVISLVTDKANFFDNTRGIYVNGNYEKSGSEWERPIHIEFFETDGTLAFSQHGGVRIHGGWTRKYPQKSFRLYADGGYDDSNEFKHEIFPGLTRKGTGKSLKSFERLILRNAGNDWTSAMLRDEFMQSLVTHLKGLDTQPYRPSVVFLNGEFWGIYHIRERYDNEYLASHYDLDDDRVAILDMYERIEVQDGVPEDATAYTNDIINYLKSNSITQQSTYENIKTKMDIDNYIDYNVAEIYFGNTDWPGNNVSIWKYKTADGKYHPEAPRGQDGRYRWFLKDTDFGFGLYGKSVTHNTLNFATAEYQESYANAQWATFLLRTLLQNPNFRNEFINRFADHLNTAFEPTRVNQKLVEAKSSIEALMPEHTNRWQVIKMTTTNTQDPTWNQTIEAMKNYATNRTSHVRQHIVSKFSANGVTGTASVRLNSDTTKGYIKINSIDVKSTTPGITTPSAWTGIYFKGVPITVKAIPEAGYEFDHWEGVTGVTSTSDTITFNLTGDMNITAVYKAVQVIPTPTPPPTPTPTNVRKCGDLNGDNEINSTDYVLLRRYLLRITDIPQEYLYIVADLNVDGYVNSTDYVILKRYLLKIYTSLPYRG